ncbi:hypothetical protein [Microbacterium panaciterrae]|uniref:Alkaline shock response membrane anchor protein AmaP n=1 Tax=Microbacterium panaciterrae TaxID=985759 RepID=A0ABP8PJN6_9MICO
MNATNRAVNRVVLLLIGIVLLLAGAAVIAAVRWPAAARTWKTVLSSAVDGMSYAGAQTRISVATTLSWSAVGVLVVLLLIVLGAVTVIARLGGGRSAAVIREEPGDGPHGAITIRQAFASDAISRSLARREEILSAHVGARRVRGTEVLQVSVTPRQNTSPADVAATVTTLVDNLATLTGRETPTLVSIRTGIRSRLAADQSRVH